jgi:hypothetical protein
MLKSGASWEYFCHARKASPGGRSPVGRNVLAATTRSNRVGLLGHEDGDR